jgi:FecR-like protein
MTPSRKCTAIKASASLALLLVASIAGAAPIGTVTNLDGTVLVTRPNGSLKVLGLNSEVEQGDVLSSRNHTYVTVTLTDDSSVTLGPDTDLKLGRFVYFKHVRDNDGAEFALARGSVRITAGVLGTRTGDTFTLVTPTATLDIRGASLVAEYVAPGMAKVAWRETMPRDTQSSNMVAVRYAPGADRDIVRTASDSNTLRLAQLSQGPSLFGNGSVAPGAAPRAPGLYVNVIDGLIQVSNPAGVQAFSAGQFGFTPSPNQQPVVVPQNPGLKFTPPPVFSATGSAPGTSTPPKSNNVDCQVR